MGEENNKNMDYIDKRQNENRNPPLKKKFSFFKNILVFLAVFVVCFVLRMTLENSAVSNDYIYFSLFIIEGIALFSAFIFLGLEFFSFSTSKILVIPCCAFRAIPYLDVVMEYRKGLLIVFFTLLWILHIALSAGSIAILCLIDRPSALFGFSLGLVSALFSDLSSFGFTKENIEFFVKNGLKFYDKNARASLKNKGEFFSFVDYLFSEIEENKGSKKRKRLSYSSLRTISILLLLAVIICVLQIRYLNKTISQLEKDTESYEFSLSSEVEQAREQAYELGYSEGYSDAFHEPCVMCGYEN